MCLTPDSRVAYSKVLSEYLHAHAAALSPDSALRLQRGSPLRVLDSKSPQDAAVVRAAPSLRAHLTACAAEVRSPLLPHSVLTPVPLWLRPW